MPASWHNSDGERGDQRGLLGAGLAITVLPAASAAAAWPDEDRQWKVPRGDGDEHAAPVEAQPVLLPRIVRAAAAAPRTASAPRRRNSAGNRPPRAIRAPRRAASCPPRGWRARGTRRCEPRTGRKRRSSSSARRCAAQRGPRPAAPARRARPPRRYRRHSHGCTVPTTTPRSCGVADTQFLPLRLRGGGRGVGASPRARERPASAGPPGTSQPLRAAAPSTSGSERSTPALLRRRG